MISRTRRFRSSVAVAVAGALATQGALAAAIVKFDVPAQPLAEAIRAVASQANTNVLFDEPLVEGKTAVAVKMEGTLDEALTSLLSYTGLTYRFVNESTVVLAEVGRSSSASMETSGVEASFKEVRLENTPESDGPSNASASANGSPRVDEVIVTGTHIRGIPPAAPVIELRRDYIERSGYTSIADVIRSLPQNFGGGVSPQTNVNAPVNAQPDNPGGASAPNLRGMGSSSTLTLINGRRLAQGLPGGGSDISSVPVAAIERVEVVTDGASAQYGSDAVAGVVNLILRKNYDGAQTGIAYGAATQGGGSEQRANQLIGKTWNNGNAFIGYEHAQQGAVHADERQFTSSTPQPYFLLPEFSNNSFALSVNQDIYSGISAFIDGFYASRHNLGRSTDAGATYTADQLGNLKQYSVASGMSIQFPSQWSLEFFGTSAQNKTTNKIYRDPLDGSPRFHSSIDSFRGKARSVEANANGSLLMLPNGALRAALGIGRRDESFSEDFLFVQSGSASSVSDGKRNVNYAYAEFSIPILRDLLNVSASARYEDYSDFGSKTVPKFGFVLTPNKQLLLRATWGKAFRAPNLSDMNSGQVIYLTEFPDPLAPSGLSNTLIHFGANPSLKPEDSESWSIGTDFHLSQFPSTKIAATLFNIAYRNRITTIGNLFGALSDPSSAVFVTRNPSEQLQQQIIAGADDNLSNLTDAPYDPTTVSAVVDARNLNVAEQKLRGLDLGGAYNIKTSSGGFDLFFNSTYLNLKQRNSPQASEDRLSGLAFYPPKFRARAGGAWRFQSLEFVAIANFLSSEKNSFVPEESTVASWTTFDASIQYSPENTSALPGFRLSISAQNVFDKNPPYLRYDDRIAGFNYDSLNTTPLGRFISFQASKEW